MLCSGGCDVRHDTTPDGQGAPLPCHWPRASGGCRDPSPEAIAAGGSEFMQYGVVLCFGTVMLAFVFTDLRDEFMVLLPGGFAGGHGTAAVYADAMPQWEAARSIGFAFATLGVVLVATAALMAVAAVRSGRRNRLDS